VLERLSQGDKVSGVVYSSAGNLSWEEELKEALQMNSLQMNSLRDVVFSGTSSRGRWADAGLKRQQHRLMLFS